MLFLRCEIAANLSEKRRALRVRKSC
jgi:hypothetical protein